MITVSLTDLIPEGFYLLNESRGLIQSFIFVFLFLITGIYVSTFLTTTWIIVGVFLAVLGGILMGSSSLFLPKHVKKRTS